MLILFSLVSSSVLPYYFAEKMGIEHLCDSKEDSDSKEKEEKKEEKKKISCRHYSNARIICFNKKIMDIFKKLGFDFSHLRGDMFGGITAGMGLFLSVFLLLFLAALTLKFRDRLLL